MKQFSLLYKSSWPAFLLMVLGDIVYFFISLANGSFKQQMGMAVDYLNQGYSGSERDKMIWWFIAISLVEYLATTIVCAISLRFTQKGRNLALAVFVCTSGWSLYQTASSPYVLSSMYPGTISPTDWVVAHIQSLLWCFIIGITIRQYLFARGKLLSETV